MSTERTHLHFNIHAITAEQLGQLGVSQIAYLKPVIVNGAAVFAIHAADGTPMAGVSDQGVTLFEAVEEAPLPAALPAGVV